MTVDPTTQTGGDGLVLAIDTATRSAVVALGTFDGQLVAEDRWTSPHRHGSELLQHLDALFAASGTSLEGVRAVVVGVGPGSFTGLRVGLATAKVVAYARALPVVAVSSLEAIAFGALDPGTEAGPGGGSAAGPETGPDGSDVPARVAVALPAGATDRYLAVVERGTDALPSMVKSPKLLAGAPGALAKAAGEGVPLVAVDLDAAEVALDVATARRAVAAGEAAVARLATGLLAIGTARLRAGATTDIAELVPAYVALPRGVAEAVSGMAWSPDLR